MSSPRVGFVCHQFPNLTQTFTSDEVVGLRRAALDVTVVSFHPPDAELLSERADLLAETRALPPASSLRFWRTVAGQAARHPAAVSMWLFRGFASRNLLRTGLADRARGVFDVLRGCYVARAFGPDLDLLHAEFANNACTAAMVAADLLSIPFSFKSHSSYNPQMLQRKSARARLVVVTSRFDRHTYFGEVPDGRILLNRAGVVGETAEVVARSGEKAGTTELICVASLVEKKGHVVLIDALALLTDLPLRLTIVGDGPEKDAVMTRVAHLGLSDRVRHLSYRPHDATLGLIGASDLFVLPAVVTPDGDRDGIPVVLMEAMVRGVPVVSTPVSGIPELVEHGRTGWLAPAADPVALADTITRVLALPASERDAVTTRARSKVLEEFDVGRNAAALAEALAAAAGH